MNTTTATGGSIARTAVAIASCHSAFGKHCAEVHSLCQDNAADSWVHLDLEKWTPMLLK